MVQDFHQVTNHFLSNPADQSRPFRRDADHHFAAIIARDRPHDVTKILQAVHETARRCSGVPHLLRNRRHRKHFLPIEVREKKKLREGNVARREFLAQMQHETALHFQDDVGKPFGIRTNLVARTSCKSGNGFRIQGDKARNARETCQTGRGTN